MQYLVEEGRQGKLENANEPVREIGTTVFPNNSKIIHLSDDSSIHVSPEGISTIMPRVPNSDLGVSRNTNTKPQYKHSFRKSPVTENIQISPNPRFKKSQG